MKQTTRVALASMAGVLLAFVSTFPSARVEAQGPAGLRLVGLTADNALLLFDPQRPGAATRVVVAGLRGTLIGIDVRPANGRLYGLTNANNLYSIEPQSGASRLVGTLTLPFDGGKRCGFDFNPQTDRLRIVGGNGQNLRVHVETGAAAADVGLAYGRKDPATGRPPAVTAAAYTQALPKTDRTVLFDIDSARDTLVMQDPPNDGQLKTVGLLGFDFADEGGFDIYTDPGGREHGFAVSGAMLYAIDLDKGAGRPLGTVGDAKTPLIGLTAMKAAP